MRVVSLSVVLIAVVAVIGVFTFAKPRYHAPGCGGCGKVLTFDDAVPPVHGWQWTDATPGFHFGEHHDEWRVMSQVGPSDVPAGAGILVASTDSPGHTEVVYWSDGCLGVRLRDGARTRLCDPKAAAVFVADARPMDHAQGGEGWSMFLTGVARSDVTRITVHARGATEVVMHGATRVVEPMRSQLAYDAKTPGWWGSWQVSTYQPVPWEATVKVYGKRGLLATTHVRFAKPGDALYCASPLRGVCGISAQRRS